MTFSIGDLIPTWVKVAAVGVVLSGVGGAVAWWHEDIAQGAYNAVFKKQVDALIQQNNEAFQRQLTAQQSKADELQKQLDNQAKIQADSDKRLADFAAQKFTNAPLDPGIKYSLDQIKRAEDARAPKTIPAPTTNVKPGTTLEKWKQTHP